MIFALSMGDLKKTYNQSALRGIGRLLNLLYKIKKQRFDISLDFSSEHRYSLISKLLGIRRRIGFNYKNRGRFLTDKINLDGYDSKHVVEYYLGLLKPLKIEAKRHNLELPVESATLAKGNNILSRFGVSDKDLLVGIAPGAGASWGKDASIKHWPAIRYAQLADNILNDFQVKILLLGDEQERPIADIIVNTMTHKAIDLVGKTTLEELLAIISELRLLITNDGGPLHIAVAEGVNTVSIFGPVDDLVYGPYPPDENHTVIKQNLPCRPCYHNFKMPICDRERECIKSISTEEVYASVRRLL
jgi:lipopolysaccharide heptosyltransferase II